MGRRRNRMYWKANSDKLSVFNFYYNRLRALAMSCFKYDGVPDSVNIRYLENTLYYKGSAVFFHDETLGYLALKYFVSGAYDVYHEPKRITAISDTSYTRKLINNVNGVVIYNDIIREPSDSYIRMFAEQLAEIDLSIMVNAHAQKTPVLIACSENERLTMENLYKDYAGNMPVIFASKQLDISGVRVLKTDAPYVADKLTELKVNKWNEALTHIGISNITMQKRERLISDEVSRSQGGTIASRYARLDARREACEKINKMFGLNMSCDFKDDFDGLDKLPNTDGTGVD